MWRSPSILVAAAFLLLPLLSTSPVPPGETQAALHRSEAHTCLGCVLVVSVIEQLAQVHNCTVMAALERLCGYLPEKLFLKSTCYLMADIFGPDLIRLLSTRVNADMVCHAIKLCPHDAGNPLCHLYPPPKEGLEKTLKKAKTIVENSQTLKHLRTPVDICSLPPLAKLCQEIKKVINNHLPFEDLDEDKYSVFPTLRGYHWRGKDCNDREKTVYPGRRPVNWDVLQDSNCNGIWGVDPRDGAPYEKTFCNNSGARGIILLGDSAGAHFHIPPEWLTATQMSSKSFSNLPEAMTNELDWPQLSGMTGFLNSTHGNENSVYLRLHKQNRCNHRDYQSISKNGASSENLLSFIKSLSRQQLKDNPALVIYSMIGNDVCNGKADTTAHMTSPLAMRSHVLEALRILDSRLPPGSHVVLSGLVDGRFLWDHLHDRFHPLGQLNKDVTYKQFYTFLSCLQVNPCEGWMSTNETLRNFTSERAAQLSRVLQEVADHEAFASFKLLYVNYPLQQIAKEWKKRGGQPWQLIEPVDGFHPSEVALALHAEFFWTTLLRRWPQALGKVNPFNDQIEKLFGDQGGH
ncbi:acyloxyacyl hydrolase isoform X1 [Tachyglossus aculeatus]|uniref:acyloxyacyl hydrolase isoform X1 n=1 Tax=Tachyglossus aculeatus TaxID=9261 RepID=UPI0018F2C399|nr:acyloxyacyl hydrolase isoform X1 [Tachyglossus aculeatus]